MMLTDSKVSNLSRLPLEENHLLPDFPPIKSQLIPQEQLRPMLNLPVPNEEKNINDDSLQGSNCELSDIFRLYGEEYRKKHNCCVSDYLNLKRGC